MKKFDLFQLPLHPFCLVVFPVLSFWADNIHEIVFGEAARSLEWGLAGTLVIFLFFWLVSRSAQKAGLSASFIVILFSTFGQAYAIAGSVLPQGSLLGQLNVLMAGWVAALIIGAWLLARKLRNPRPLTVIANVIGLAAVVTALYPAGVYFGRNLLAGPAQLKQPADLTPQVSAPAVKPDIYYIILDGYGRNDTLREIYSLDNSAFLRFLEERGFTVTTQSNANYPRTMLSLSSSLNYHYLDELMEAQPDSIDYSAYRKLLKDSAVQRILKAQGYRTAAFATGYEITELYGADTYYDGKGRISYFEEKLLVRTMAIAWLDRVIEDFRREEVLQSLDDLSSAVDLPGPKFVFAHMVVPHPPFVFDENGGPLPPQSAYAGEEATRSAYYLNSYRRQVQYVDKVIEELVVKIQERPGPPPIIIIQGDHGPDALIDWVDWEKTCLRERMPILNAYYLPGEASAEIPLDITPVNTFRLVLNRYFGASLPMLNNRNYYVLLARPYDYIDVTGRLDQCPALK